MMHDYHPGLPGYDADAILHDGCGECEARAAKGLKGLLELDANNLNLLWRRVLNTEYGGNVSDGNGRYRSGVEGDLGHHLYLVGVLLERSGENPWRLDRFDLEGS